MSTVPPTVPPTVQRSVRRVEWTYYLIVSLFWFGVSLPAALGILIVQSRGMSLAQIGVLLALYSLTIVLLEVPTGGLADAIGRKRVALLAYGAAAMGSLAYLFAFGFTGLALAFIFNGVARALSSGALDAWFVDSLQALDPDIELQPRLARAGIFTLLALGIGTLLGSTLPLLFSQLPPEGSAILTPFTTTLIGSIFIQLCALLAAALLVKEERDPASMRDWLSAFQRIPQLVAHAAKIGRENRTIRLLLGATAFSAAAVISLELLWQPRFADLLGGSEGKSLYFGMILAGSFLAGMVGHMVATPISRLLGQRYALVAAIFTGLRGITLIVLAFQAGVPLAVLLFWFVYLNMGVADSPHGTLFNLEAPAEHRSSLLSISSLAG